ncbi:hypothetical protein BASA83_010639 [Batrachochytrium salamandrivorans]|nr:hypothetical protein BASA83_010639 [Batrachochytrium salamandrivorans]
MKHKPSDRQQYDGLHQPTVVSVGPSRQHPSPVLHQPHHQRKLKRPNNTAIRPYTRRRPTALHQDPSQTVLSLPRCLILDSTVYSTDRAQTGLTESVSKRQQRLHSTVQKTSSDLGMPDPKAKSVALARARLRGQYEPQSSSTSMVSSYASTTNNETARTFVATKPVSSSNERPTIVKHVLASGISIPEAAKAIKGQQKVLFGMAFMAHTPPNRSSFKSCGDKKDKEPSSSPGTTFNTTIPETAPSLAAPLTPAEPEISPTAVTTTYSMTTSLERDTVSSPLASSNDHPRPLLQAGRHLPKSSQSFQHRPSSAAASLAYTAFNSFHDDEGSTQTQSGDTEESTQNYNDPHALGSTKLNLPMVVVNHDLFFSGDGFERSLFNAWYRKNGWHRPFHARFLLHIFVWLFVVGVYFLFILRFVYPLSVRYVMYGTTGLGTLLQLACMIGTLSVDPQDSNVRRSRIPRNTSYVKQVGVPVIDPDTLFCQICQVHVGIQTKHCKPCNKCVGVYDHHCDYLSTCIGKRNYKVFFATILFGFIMTYAISSVALYAFVQYFTDRDTFANIVMELFQRSNESDQKTVAAMIFTYMVLVMVIAGGATNLFLFHARISYVGVTTIGYLESRAARGPDLWHINTKEYKKSRALAHEFSNSIEPADYNPMDNPWHNPV